VNRLVILNVVEKPVTGTLDDLSVDPGGEVAARGRQVVPLVPGVEPVASIGPRLVVETSDVVRLATEAAPSVLVHILVVNRCPAHQKLVLGDEGVPLHGDGFTGIRLRPAARRKKGNCE